MVELLKLKSYIKYIFRLKISHHNDFVSHYYDMLSRNNGWVSHNAKFIYCIDR